MMSYEHIYITSLHVYLNMIYMYAFIIMTMKDILIGAVEPSRPDVSRQYCLQYPQTSAAANSSPVDVPEFPP